MSHPLSNHFVINYYVDFDHHIRHISSSIFFLSKQSPAGYKTKENEGSATDYGWYALTIKCLYKRAKKHTRIRTPKNSGVLAACYTMSKTISEMNIELLVKPSKSTTEWAQQYCREGDTDDSYPAKRGCRGGVLQRDIVTRFSIPLEAYRRIHINGTEPPPKAF